MGRKRTSPRPRAIHVNIPEDVLALVDEKLYDPYKGKPIYGGYSILVTHLLRKWLEDPSILPIQLVEEPVDD
jgi:hypothetical protein